MPTTKSASRPDTVFLAANAHWIWSAEASRAYHNVVCFRREFEIAGDVIAAAANPGEAGAPTLLITADSRYEVYVNGVWLGHGPARSWPSPWPIDPYDLRDVLRPGRNVLAVLVQHFGIGTFQYLHAEPGLLAQLTWRDSGGIHTLVTDDSGDWRASPHAGHLWPVPRISCMQPWEEQYDARAFPHDWAASDPAPATAASLAAWPAAVAVRKAGEGSHAQLVLRDIPQLTREPVDPVRVRAVEAVRPARYSWNLNPRAYLNSHDATANVPRGAMLLFTHIHSERAQAVEFHQPHHRPFVPWTLNGKPLAFDDHSLQRTDTGVAQARLKAGWNTLMCTLPPHDHYWWVVISAWTAQPVQWAAQPPPLPPPPPTHTAATAATAWLAIGPFGNPDDPTPPALVGSEQHMIDATTIPAGATLAQFEAIRARGALRDDEFAAAYVRPLTRDMVADTDVYAQCASERILPDITPRVRVQNLSALQHDTADWTIIHPLPPPPPAAKNARDAVPASVRLLLDFGREVIGYHEFEIDAPAGTIIDNHNFEFIQPDGRHNLAESMNNTFRYICREGAQRYRTLVRRGFQYSWFSLRNFQRPVRIRHIRVLLSTYPQERQGSFACSDAWLDRIWETGAHSVRCCSEDTYTDCPSYEQTFWVGDARNEALVDLVANGDPRLSAHAWRIVAQSLDRSPLAESQVPSAWENILPAWSFLWMRWGEEHYRLTGDRAFAREAIRAFDRNVDGIEKFLSPRGLIKIRAWNMFDWAAMDTPPGGEITHINCLAVLGLRQCAGLARALGREAAPQARRWTALADRLAAAVNAHLWDAKRRAYIDCIRPDGTRSSVFSQQTHTAAYIAGVPTPSHLKRTREIMGAAPEGFVSAGSPFFMFFVLEGLAREGRGGDMVRLIRDYWGKQVEAGATAFWEMYHADRPRMTRSHCHGWSAAPTYFLSGYVLGVQPAEPGYATVRIAPQPGGLRWARGRVPTPSGVVEVSWKFSDAAEQGRRGKGTFELRIVLPAGVPAEIELPSETGLGSKSNFHLGVLAGKVVSDGAPRRLRATAGTDGLVHLVVG
ncbi:family 78 glycoside hydrolase catalytic domain [Geminisphaera colitermitum]|uniref:family 78 glycoside hydrolase catalytic domain n=1 Tax=Geminisphaera colitermitum TaxID=1148786 RepID=UPI000694B4B1|nr:family 78 glycoside hydrolase catalytic domain [Geminisphaera colitermitum]